jgi:E3 SUMO-protein ligase NSE2
LLSAQDLRSDPILVRKIRRIQKANEAASDEEPSDHEGRSSVPSRRQPKSKTPAGQAPPRSSTILDLEEDESESETSAVHRPPRSSMILDLDEDESDEDESDEEMEDE